MTNKPKLPSEPPRGQKIIRERSAARRKEIKRLRDMGYSLKQIAKKMGFTNHVIIIYHLKMIEKQAKIDESNQKMNN